VSLYTIDARGRREVELLADYNFVLAYTRGFWCLDEKCESCIENLFDFSRERLLKQS